MTLAGGSAAWGWHFHPDVWLLLAFVAGGYGWALRSLGPRYVEPGERSASPGQRMSFILGLLALWGAADWPVHDLAEGYLYSAHMVQHLLLTLVAPPLLLMGTPHWLARRLLRPRPAMWLARRLTRPLPALLTFNAVLIASHWPLVVDLTLSYHPVHFVAHAVLIASAFVMWWPVLSPLPELPRISYPAQMLYLFLQTILPTVPASFLTFSSYPIYKFYETAPRLMGLSVIDDQRIAGLTMKLGAGFLLWGVITVLFFRFSSKEEKPEKPDVLEWHQIERDLNEAVPPEAMTDA